MHGRRTFNDDRNVPRSGLKFRWVRSVAMGHFRTHVDLAMERPGLFYVRFMDDILVLAPTGGHCA